jgi:16S rRNA processing protein RimM
MRGTASHRQTQHGANTSVAHSETRGFIAIARVLRPQGRKGEVLAEILTDFPERFARLERAFLDEPGASPGAVTVEDAWFHKGKVVLKFAGVGSIGDAEQLRGRYILVPEEERIPLSAHQYYLSDLEGCQVVVESGGPRRVVGTVTEVQQTGGVDLLHVSDGAREVLVPFARAICKVIDPEARLIVIDPPEDLLDLNQE